MELYGSPTTKEIKKKHSPRLVGGTKMGSEAERIAARQRLGDPARRQIVHWGGQAAAGLRGSSGWTR